MSFFSEDDDDDDQDTDDFFGVEDDEKFAEMLFFSKNKNNRNRFVSFFFICPNTGIPRFTLLMWGHTKKTRKKKPPKSRLFSSTKGEENRIEL